MTMALAALASTMRAYSGCTLLSRPMTSCMRLMFTKEARSLCHDSHTASAIPTRLQQPKQQTLVADSHTPEALHEVVLHILHAPG